MVKRQIFKCDKRATVVARAKELGIHDRYRQGKGSPRPTSRICLEIAAHEAGLQKTKKPAKKTSPKNSDCSDHPAKNHKASPKFHAKHCQGMSLIGQDGKTVWVSKKSGKYYKWVKGGEMSLIQF